MKRREFLRMAGKTAVLLSVAGQTGFVNVGCQQSGNKAIVTKKSFEVAADLKLPKVVLARNENHAEALKKALDAIGGIRRFIQKGDKVLLKPNAAFERVPEQAVNTNPILVGEMTRQCLIAGASDVIVTDHAGNDNQRQVFSRSGITDAVEQNGGRIAFLNKTDFLNDNLNGQIVTDWPVLKYIFEVDRLINMPIAKHHDFALGTASMKNFFGAIGGNRGQLHEHLDQVIVDLASYFRPTLTVVDATRVLMKYGPSGGSFGDVKKCDTVICATDQVAADARSCELLGRTGGEISYIVLAAKQGLGEIDYHKAGYLEIG